MAGRRDGKRPSMFEVAKLAGVSHQTVSRVINDSPDVAPKTRAKVQAAIDELGYLPSNSARSLASQRSHTIGLIAGGHHFFGPVSAMAAIEESARAHRLYTSVMLLPEASVDVDEYAGLCRRFEEQNVDAFIVIAPTDEMFEAAIRVPVRQPRIILTSTHGAMSAEEATRLLTAEQRRRVSIVGNDQWGAMQEVARLVAGRGHRRVLYFAGPRDWRDACTRLEGWNRACASLSVNTVTVQCQTWDSGESYRKMNHVLENIGRNGGRPPSCVVCANDNMAVGVLRALHEHGVRVPQDVSVVGFDDLPAMADLTPPLTTVHPDFERLGAAAMTETLFLLGEGPEHAFSISRHGVGLIPMDVVQRRSLGTAGSF
ncbi:LacI family DNA-binding transcriptional regulator [Bifidobacterium choloepi]|uniref:LacI family DNA-binding transcriptional regulator n=1 Tax=Bifidobacterium choloepi TaxID=2614131 RepID=A0A6I5NJA2_9BIFI|nr:LacI family DNA-binding transcriptional regulator [Bifidobacterium choloepi]NEG70463.1 LacI family DNA-binding transcriptional regulator [Bifidobacterium choloepi]